MVAALILEVRLRKNRIDLVRSNIVWKKNLTLVAAHLSHQHVVSY